MSFHPESGITENLFEEERRPTPIAKIEDRPDGRWVLLQPGANHSIYMPALPIEPASEVQKVLGVKADLIAEIFLSSKYTLCLFDRGKDSQGVETPIIPGSRLTVSDRFLIADEGFMVRANMRHGTSRDLPNLNGLYEFCEGSIEVFGQAYDHSGRFDTKKMPKAVSGKHMALAVDGNVLNISDAYSTNLTKIHYKAN